MIDPETMTCPECDVVPNAYCEWCEGAGSVCVECGEPPSYCECGEDE